MEDNKIIITIFLLIHLVDQKADLTKTQGQDAMLRQFGVQLEASRFGHFFSLDAHRKIKIS